MLLNILKYVKAYPYRLVTDYLLHSWVIIELSIKHSFNIIELKANTKQTMLTFLYQQITHSTLTCETSRCFSVLHKTDTVDFDCDYHLE